MFNLLMMKCVMHLTLQESISVPWKALPRKFSKLYFAMRGVVNYCHCYFHLFFKEVVKKKFSNRLKKKMRKLMPLLKEIREFFPGKCQSYTLLYEK